MTENYLKILSNTLFSTPSITYINSDENSLV